mmetsp:Transcript_41049/g.95225  ORF Transcript_41049/g.95225 Transcript_41049/m.95225 type:complete len:207 (-) Transcript_41049:301-921(-)
MGASWMIVGDEHGGVFSPCASLARGEMDVESPREPRRGCGATVRRSAKGALALEARRGRMRPGHALEAARGFFSRGASEYVSTGSRIVLEAAAVSCDEVMASHLSCELVRCANSALCAGRLERIFCSLVNNAQGEAVWPASVFGLANKFLWKGKSKGDLGILDLRRQKRQLPPQPQGEGRGAGTSRGCPCSQAPDRLSSPAQAMRC